VEAVTLILTALGAGASGGALDALKDDVWEKARAAYEKLDGLVKKRVSGSADGQLALAKYEAAPQKWERLLAAELTEAGAADDADLVAAAKALLEILAPPGARAAKYNVTINESKGVQIGDGNFQINNL
jgi:hypothetical protein